MRVVALLATYNEERFVRSSIEHLRGHGIDVRFMDPDMVRLKAPRFAHNDGFDLSSFGIRFSHFLLRSIWTHASKPQIEAMLDAFGRWSTPDGVMLTSFYPASPERPDYQGPSWVGRSHRSSERGMVAHDLGWIEKACARRGLLVAPLPREPIAEQVWLAIRYARPAG